MRDEHMKKEKNSFLNSVKGGITAAKGFTAAGVKAGIKSLDMLDLGVVFSQRPCSAAGAFTTNAVKAACVKWNQGLVPSNAIHAICCNSGNANSCTGSRGRKDVITTARTLARQLLVKKESVLIASTGIIGKFLPMNNITAAIPALAASLSEKKGVQFARAIMTTDTVDKQYAVEVSFTQGKATIGGCVKGAGMIQPKMATMLCFLTTDAAISPKKLTASVKKTVEITFNNLTVDGDTSTNDMVLVLANGASGVAIATKRDEELFEKALFEVCNTLCEKIASDGEGATKRIEITVHGGKTYQDCRMAAKAVANSNLVKTALFGNDPNWGRILCAVGYSNARFSQKKIRILLCGIPLYEDMRPVQIPPKRIFTLLKNKIVPIEIDLGFKTRHQVIAQTCDFSFDYVRINAEYHT